MTHHASLFFGTTNQGKIVEAKAQLSPLGVNIMSLNDLPKAIDPPAENGDTFEANAIVKARYYAQHTHMPTVCDDSGIIVDALKSELGIHTRRWGAGADATDAEWTTYFLQRMERETNRRALFVCSIAFVDHQGALHLFTGSCEGRITYTLEADYLPGLPLSACFIPQGMDRVFSALTPEEKSLISHRGRALTAFAQFLQQQPNP